MPVLQENKTIESRINSLLELGFQFEGDDLRKEYPGLDPDFILFKRVDIETMEPEHWIPRFEHAKFYGS